MSFPRHISAGLVLAALVIGGAAPRALVQTMTTADVDRALAIARATDSERADYHARYVFSPPDPAVDSLEAITEFRRVVLAGEDRARIGDWMFLHSPGSAQTAVQRWHGLVTIVAKLRFHPQNVLRFVPAYTIAVDGPAAGAPLASTDERTSPIWSNPDRHSSALLGALVESDYRAAEVGNGPRRLAITLDGSIVAAVTVDFSRLD